MKILVLTDDLPPVILGGSGRMAWETAKGLHERGHDVTILTAGTFPAAIDPMSPDGLRRAGGIAIRTIPRLPQRWAHYRSVWSTARERAVLQIIDDVQPDVIHAHGLAWQLGYRWIVPAKKRGIRIVHTFHGVMSIAYGKVFPGDRFPLMRDLLVARWTYNPLRNILAKRALLHCDALLSVSDALRIYVQKRGYRGMSTLHNGIDTEFWTAGPTREDARRTLHLPLHTTIFLFAGRIGHDKGMTAVKNALPHDALLLIAGEGDSTTWSDLGDRVQFFPHQNAEGMRTLYAAATATLSASLYLDPFPTVCLESMMCATPVIATSHGGSKEAVEHGITGWVVDPTDHRAFSEALATCAADQHEAIRRGQAAREHAKQRFGLQAHLDRLLEIYASKRS